MPVVVNKSVVGQRSKPTAVSSIRAPGFQNASGTQSINGWTFALQAPARAACFQQDGVELTWYRFEVAPGDICVAVDGGGAVVERCELSSTNTLSFTTAYTIRYQIKVYTPGAKDAASAGWIIIGQLHQTPDVGDAGVSPLYAREIISSPRAIGYNQRTSLVDPIVSSPSSNYFYTDGSPTLAWNRWISVVENHYIDPNTTAGYHRIYHDGVLVANYAGKTGYVDAVGPYYKFGIYRAADATNTLVIEYKNFSVTSP